MRPRCSGADRDILWLCRSSCSTVDERQTSEVETQRPKIVDFIQERSIVKIGTVVQKNPDTLQQTIRVPTARRGCPAPLHLRDVRRNLVKSRKKGSTVEDPRRGPGRQPNQNEGQQANAPCSVYTLHIYIYTYLVNVCTYICTCVCMYVCTYVRMHACMRIYNYTYTCTSTMS